MNNSPGYAVFALGKVDTAIRLVADYQNGSELADAEYIRCTLAKVIGEFCDSAPILKEALGISNQQLIDISEGGEIPQDVVQKLAKRLAAVRRSVALGLKS